MHDNFFDIYCTLRIIVKDMVKLYCTQDMHVCMCVHEVSLATHIYVLILFYICPSDYSSDFCE